MAPEVLSNISKPESKKYGPPVDWWGLGCIVYQFFSHKHKARVASSFAAILLIHSFQTLFQTQDHILHYADWCTGPDGRDKQLSLFKGFPAMFRDLISGVSSYCSFSNTIIYLYGGSCWIPARHRGMDSARSQAIKYSCLHVASRNFLMRALVVSEIGFV
jgi:serine/threonine protein kinase